MSVLIKNPQTDGDRLANLFFQMWRDAENDLKQIRSVLKETGMTDKIGKILEILEED